ncbi:MAG: tetratricopeptide repeat protein [Spirochaetales bacterium]
MMNEGIRLLNSGQYERALTYLLDIDVSAEQYPQLSYYLGLCYTHMGKYDEALLYLEQVVGSELSFSHIFQARMILGYIYAVTRRFRLAEFEFRHLLDEGFDSARARSALAYVLHSQGELQEAIEELERAIELDPENGNALNSLGFILADHEIDARRAADLCRRAVQRSPKNASYLDSLGWALYKLGQAEQARDILRDALDLAPRNKEIASHLREVMYGKPEARS